MKTPNTQSSTQALSSQIAGIASVIGTKPDGDQLLVGVRFQTRTEALAVITVENGQAMCALPVTVGYTSGFSLGEVEALNRADLTSLGLLAHELRGTEKSEEELGLTDLPARFEALLRYAADHAQEEAPVFRLVAVQGDGLIVTLSEDEQKVARIDLTRQGSLALRMRDDQGKPKVLAVSNRPEADIIGIPPLERKGRWTNARVNADGIVPVTPQA